MVINWGGNFSMANSVHHHIQHFIVGCNCVCTIFISVHFYDTRQREPLMRMLYRLLNCWEFCQRYTVCPSLNQFVNDVTDMYLWLIFYISLPFVDIPQLFLLQRLSIQQLRLFTWYRAAITWQLKVSLQAMMNTLTKTKSLNATTYKNDMDYETVHLVEACVLAKQLLDFITGEGSESFLVQSCCKRSAFVINCLEYALLVDLLLRSLILRVVCCMVIVTIFCACTYCHEIWIKHILESLSFVYVCNFGRLSVSNVWNHQFQHHNVALCVIP